MLTAEKQWIDYGKPDDHAYGYTLTANNTSFSTESLDVKLALKNADKGYYSVDGSAKKEFVNGDSVKVGEGKIGNSKVTLTLYATGADGVETEQTYTFKRLLQRQRQLSPLNQTATQQSLRAAITAQTLKCSSASIRQSLLTVI